MSTKGGRRSDEVTNPIRDAPAFRRLLAARTVSHVGDGIALIALVLMVQGGQVEGALGTGTSVGALLLATSIRGSSVHSPARSSIASSSGR